MKWLWIWNLTSPIAMTRWTWRREGCKVVDPAAGANSDPGATFLVAWTMSWQGSCFLQSVQFELSVISRRKHWLLMCQADYDDQSRLSWRRRTFFLFPWGIHNKHLANQTVFLNLTSLFSPQKTSTWVFMEISGGKSLVECKFFTFATLNKVREALYQSSDHSCGSLCRIKTGNIIDDYHQMATA